MIRTTMSRLAVGCVLAVCTLAVPAAASAAPPAPLSTPVAAQAQPHADQTRGPSQIARVQRLVLQRTNQFRASRGRPPVRLKIGVRQVAQRWTARMARTGDFEHNPQVGQQIPDGWTGWGENIAAGYRPADVVDGWIDSPGHRRNLLGDFTHLGVGFKRDADGYPYYTQVFARYPRG